MARGFRLEEHHIAHTLVAHAIPCSDALLDRVFGLLDVSAVERAALRGVDRASQATHACAEIWGQIQAVVGDHRTPEPLLQAA